MKNHYTSILKELIFTSILLITCTVNATVYYVTPNGAGNRNGLSWANAFAGNLLQTTINNAAINDQVWVACGTYLPTTTTNRAISFSMKNGVAIYGGFKGTETSLQQRVNECGPCSILSGEIGNAGFSDNSYKIISNTNLNETAIIDGFVVSGANDNRGLSNLGNGLGGGIYNHGLGSGGNCSPTVQNCIFTSNRASFGSGAFNNGYAGGNSNPAFNNCVFYNNHAFIGAGAMDSYGVRGNASPTIRNTIFYGNTSDTNVGAMYAWGGDAGGNSSPTLINCVFANNRALNGFGGAFIADNLDENNVTSSGTSIVTLHNCIVWNNSATGEGQQFYVKGNGAKVIANYSTIDLTSQTGSNALDATSQEVLTTNPMFVDVLNAMGLDNCWLTNDDGLRLQEGSLSINNGNNSFVFTTDITGQPRILASIVDRGAYEYEPTLGGANFESTQNNKVYPNPINDFVVIETQDALQSDFYIQNMLGQNVKNLIRIIEKTNNKIILDTKDLPLGLYLITNANTTVKIVKN